MKEIVAVMIGTIITNDKKTFLEALQSNRNIGLLDRKHMQFMAACDLGDRWRALAEADTLFCVDDKGEYHPPKETHDA